MLAVIFYVLRLNLTITSMCRNEIYVFWCHCEWKWPCHLQRPFKMKFKMTPLELECNYDYSQIQFLYDVKYNFKSRQHPICSAHSWTLCASAFQLNYWLFIANVVLTSSHHYYYFLNSLCSQNTIQCSPTCVSLIQPSLSPWRRPTFSISEERSAVSCCELLWARRSAGRKIRYQLGLAVGSSYYC